MVYEPVGATLENDGEVRVFIPWSPRGGSFKSLDRAETQRRTDITRREFLEKYPVTEEAEETKVKLFAALGINQEELTAAMWCARANAAEYRSLAKLVHACRKQRTKHK
jgi:hypothetical protein